MHPSRREFLQSSLAGGSLVACGLSVPTFLSRTAAAAPLVGKPGAKETILVVIQLTGGNDGLNMVIPYADPDYAKLRPTIGFKKANVKTLDDKTGLHPLMNGLAGLWEDKSLCVVQGVGYPNPSQSHFRSMDIWNAGSTNKTLSEGWLGKALKKLQTPAFHVATNKDSSPLALAGAPTRPPSITSLADFQLKLAAETTKEKKEQQALIEGAAKLKTNKPGLLDFVERTAVNTYASSKRLQEIGKNYEPKAPYPPTALANRLKLAAQLINADLGARIFYVSLDGFDTHSNQLPQHANLMSELSEAMTAFYKDMAAQGHKDRIIMMTFSEFGRRPYENGSKGTDHGAAAPMLLVGGKIKPGIIGKQPKLTGTTDGNLVFNTDFRQVYGAILDQWLGVPSRDVLGETFKSVEIVKA